MNILLVSYFYRPSILSGSRRLGMLVDALRSKGHSVSVLAGGGPFPNFNELNVYRPKYRDWWWTLHARAKKHGVISWYKSRFKQSKLNTPVRSMWWTSFSEVLFPDKYVSWIRPATTLGLELIKKHNIDLIYSSFPAPSSHVVARRLKKAADLPWVCELRDLWVDSPHDVPRGSFARFNKWFEKRILKEANAFIGVTKKITDVLQNKYNKSSHTIYSPIEPFRNQPQTSDNVFCIVYTGALYSGSRDISSLIRAIKLLEKRGEVSPKSLIFRYVGYDDRTSIEAMFARYDATAYLSYGGRVSRDEAMLEQSRAALLYVVPMSSDKRFDGIMTAKVFEYLGHRKPILATSVIGGELDNFLRETGCGISLVEPEDIATALAGWIKNYMNGDANLGEFCPREDVLCRHTAEESANKMIQIFQSVLGN